MDMMTKDQMLDQYEVLGFALGVCVVRRKSDGKRGVLDFENREGIRYYYNFQEA
jgi:hypothetical protein